MDRPGRLWQDGRRGRDLVSRRAECRGAPSTGARDAGHRHGSCRRADGPPWGDGAGHSPTFSHRRYTPFAGVRDANADSAAAEGDAAGSSGGTTGASSGSSAAAADDDASGENRVLSLLGVFRIGVDAGELGGVASLMLLFIAINVFIGLFNLLPVLPFDGGHVAIAIYEKFQEWRKGMTTRYLADVGRLIPMTYAVVGVMVMLFLSTVYLDIANPISVR